MRVPSSSLSKIRKLLIESWRILSNKRFQLPILHSFGIKWRRCIICEMCHEKGTVKSASIFRTRPQYSWFFILDKICSSLLRSNAPKCKKLKICKSKKINEKVQVEWVSPISMFRRGRTWISTKELTATCSVITTHQHKQHMFLRIKLKVLT